MKSAKAFWNRGNRVTGQGVIGKTGGARPPRTTPKFCLRRPLGLRSQIWRTLYKLYSILHIRLPSPGGAAGKIWEGPGGRSPPQKKK